MSAFEVQIKDTETSDLSKNLNQLMIEYGIDAKSLNQATGISVSAINALKRGEGNPTLWTLLELAKFFNCSIDELVGLGKNTAMPHNTKLIPVYSLADAGKRDQISIIERIVEDCGGFNEQELFCVKIHNNAFSPFFERGAYLIASTKNKYTDGDLVILATKDSDILVKKIFAIGAKEIKFASVSLEPEFNEYSEFKIIGVIIKIIQPLY